ncbi:MAG: hypothetical protein A2Y12_03330 [Planctomycetes bacterium GWF2_42_9]|nr:MAG: hypothetical protein A2Y12_03330 [Planctomycetes bacterium GWF2_42_9]
MTEAAKKKYVIVGTGSRSKMFQKAITETYKSTSVLIAVCDINLGRADLAARACSHDGIAVEVYHSKDFDKMLQRHKPDVVVVCTRDKEHSEYICRSLEAGSDVITEKPMTIDEKKCQQIIDTVRKTGKSVRVTFNYRYSPIRSQIKEILMRGEIGDIQSVIFQWNLDTKHGADYFRRWHRNKENSGGLLVHKATHHFDLVNWWIRSRPVAVASMGKRGYYVPAQADALGLNNPGQRCFDCESKKICKFYLNLKDSNEMEQLYLNNEKQDGYYRDKCVFSTAIDIEDSANVMVKYENGVLLSYALTAFSPWEGYRIEFNGTRGRLEHKCIESSYINGDGTIQGQINKNESTITMYPHFASSYSIEVPDAKGGHGGGDDVMLQDLFGIRQNDPLERAADYVQGAWSILTGIAANRSVENGQFVSIDSLVDFSTKKS